MPVCVCEKNVSAAGLRYNNEVEQLTIGYFGGVGGTTWVGQR